MRIIIDILIGVTCLAAGYALRLIVEEVQSRELPDLSNGQDDPGYRPHETEER